MDIHVHTHMCTYMHVHVHTHIYTHQNSTQLKGMINKVGVSVGNREWSWGGEGGAVQHKF